MKGFCESRYYSDPWNTEVDDYSGAIGAWIKNVEPGEEDSVPNGVDGHET